MNVVKSDCDWPLVLGKVKDLRQKFFQVFQESAEPGSVVVPSSGSNVLISFMSYAHKIDPVVVNHLVYLRGLDLNHKDKQGSTALIEGMWNKAPI